MQNPPTRSAARRIAIISLLLFLALGAVFVREKRLHDRDFVPLRAVTVPQPYPRMAQRVAELAFSSDGQTLAAAEGQGRLSFWDAETLRQIDFLDHVTPDTGSYANYLAWSLDGKTLAVGNSNTLSLWNLAAGTRQILMPNEYRHLSATVWLAHNGRQVVSPSLDLAALGEANGYIMVWETRTNRRRFMDDFPKHDLSDLAFSPDGAFLAVVLAPYNEQAAYVLSEVSLYQTQTGKRQRVFQ